MSGEPVPAIGSTESAEAESRGLKAEGGSGISLFDVDGGRAGDANLWSNCSDGPALTLVLPDEAGDSPAHDEPKTTPEAAAAPHEADAETDRAADEECEPRLLLSTAELAPISRPSRFFAPTEAAAEAQRTVVQPAPPPAPAPTLLIQEPASELKAPPLRVGSGQLAAGRLNWRPGDPFGDSRPAETRFRWELMLTTACGTAACGLVGIWLLRTLLS